MEEHKHVTIYDIAKKLNLATSTISRALKDHHSLSDKTIKKVKQTAREMGFVPNTLAAGLRGNKSRTIGILIPTVTQPFLSSLISGIEIAARKSEYSVIIMQSHDSYEVEVDLAKSLYSNRVSGVICSLAMETKDTSHFKQFSNNNIPLVFVDRVPRDYDTFRVVINNHLAGYKATKHLIEQGCKRIAHLTAGSEFGTLYNERKRGYIDALLEHDLPVDENLIISLKQMTYEEGVKACNYLFDLKEAPDGLFAPGDILAVSAVQTAKKRGIKVPEEFAVIGFNNDPISEIIEPNISTITHPAEKMGKAAAELIIKNLKSAKEEDAKEITFLNTQVLIRESSRKI
ncbi:MULTISPECIES: LacI family DNA-binding transcriptional regulator [unclassified Flavobacterium]|uniref:LacI family DNA-binding transcriptional regulator n=1 Tax=unclassified Flavobacterium TaxID=196869 RepID=UPI0012AA3A30|nr:MULTISPECIES: LacI family DNA-binding transcriptional regulator [unclassified Flavobacterium]MBF4487587.1 LacI family DNA-binding transcriptional regulator [Flavobacterium sp. CSZ]QGK73826.1 substrate-binding domain-containing protein [Flavobacterium sp. SLB02]